MSFRRVTRLPRSIPGLLLHKTYRPTSILLRRDLHSSSCCASKYPSFFIKPIYQPEEYEQLKTSGELDKLANLPVKASEIDENQSVWHDPLVNKLINMVMEENKKILARDLIETAFEHIKRHQLELYHNAASDAEREKIVLNPYAVFHQAVNNARPLLETMPMKRAGTTYQVPVPTTENKSRWKALKWIIAAAQSKGDDVRFHNQLAKEVLDAANNVGRVVKKKHDLHKLCEANKAYAHFRWQ